LACAVEWTDVGDAEKYRTAVARFENFDFSKQNEALYIVNRKVIKFFTDEAISRRRVQKAALNPRVFPRITHHRGQFYAYDFQPGETLYTVNSPELFQRLLGWLNASLWLHKDVSRDVMRQTCLRFYRDKTQERITLFHQKYGVKD